MTDSAFQLLGAERRYAKSETVHGDQHWSQTTELWESCSSRNGFPDVSYTSPNGVGRQLTFSPALRLKFIELYRLQNPTGTTVPLSRTHSPTTASPPRSAVTPTSPQTDISRDPFSQMVREMVKLIQASLAIWGLFGTDREDLELDGLFCNETKEGILRWRQIMGMTERLEVSGTFRVRQEDG